MHLEYFPQVALELDKELQNHPLLVALLRSMGPMDLESKLGHIAAYCSVGVDGYYLEEDIEQLFHLLLSRLRDKNVIHIQ